MNIKVNSQKEIVELLKYGDVVMDRTEEVEERTFYLVTRTMNTRKTFFNLCGLNDGVVYHEYGHLEQPDTYKDLVKVKSILNVEV